LAAKAAVDSLGQVLTLQAIETLGEAATEETVTEWVLARPEWARARILHAQFFGAWDVWVKSNATAVSGEKIQDLDLKLAISAAQELFSFVGRYVPAVSHWVAVGETKG